MAGPEQSVERGKIVIARKRELMLLLVEKSLEYFKQCEPASEIVVQEIIIQYESLIDASLKLVQESIDNNVSGSILGKVGGVTT